MQQPLLAAPLAFFSHFLLDIIPHFGGTPIYEFGHKYFLYIMAGDALITINAITLICFLSPSLAAVIILCALCAVLPDIILFTYYTSGKPNTWFHKTHLKIQWYEHPPGAIVELSYAILMSTVIGILLWRTQWT